MMRLAPLAPVLAAAACGLPDVPYDGNTRATFIFEPGNPEFTIYVYPRTAPRDVVIDESLGRAHPHCSTSFGSTKVEIATLVDGTFAKPTEWRVDGRCA